MKHIVITIGREYGSGGRLIAKKLSEDMGITFYDKQLISDVAKKTGFSEHFIRNAEHQRPTNSFLYDLYTSVQTPSVPDQVFIAQAKVIKEAAARESCVIVGRCADYILKDRPDCLHTFIHASPEFRADRIVRLYGESEVAPEKRLSDKDTRRANNYRHYTGREWGTAQNYHLCLDSSVIGVEKCADIILDLVKDSENT